MSNLYTLRKELSGASGASIMNGKVFKGKFDSCNQLEFIDAATGKTLRSTTKVVSKEKTKDGIIVTTKSGTVYDLIDVLTLLPTYGPVKSKDKTLLGNVANEQESKSKEVSDAANKANPLPAYTADEIRRFNIDNYRTQDASLRGAISQLRDHHNISNIGELERAVANSTISGVIATDAIAILRIAGFEVKEIGEIYNVKFVGFPNIVNTAKLRPIGFIHSMRHAHYCDAWITNEYVFANKKDNVFESADESDFKEFCAANKLKIQEKEEWYNSYTVIEQHYDTWMHRKVDPYTD